MITIVQALDVSVQDAGRVTLPVPTCEKVTVPVGEDPDTETEQVSLWPTVNELQEMLVVVEGRALTTMPPELELPALLESPL